nr:Chain B, peptide substrate VSGYAV [synthetic construct]
VSGYAV